MNKLYKTLGAAAIYAAAVLPSTGCKGTPQTPAEYRQANDITANLIVVQKEDNSSRFVVFGLYKGDHMELEGTVEEHAEKLNFSLDDALNRSQAIGSGKDFGYRRDTSVAGPSKKRQIVDWSAEVPQENWKKVAVYFSDGDVTNEAGERITADTYKAWINAGKVVSVRIAYTGTPKPEVKEEEAAPAAESVTPED